MCAEAAAALARAANKPDQECYLAGLLCDIGALARHVRAGAQAPAPRAQDLSWSDSQTTIMVLAEAEDAWIGRGWLPPFVADALRLRKEAAETLADAPCVVRALKVALTLADGGASESARLLGKELLGLDLQQITRAADAALAATRQSPVGFETAREASPSDTRWDLGGHAACATGWRGAARRLGRPGGAVGGRIPSDPVSGVGNGRQRLGALGSCAGVAAADVQQHFFSWVTAGQRPCVRL